MRFQVEAQTDTGKKRTQNQDSFIALPDLGLFIVADGMGGHRGGEIASAMATEIITQCIRTAQQSPDWHPASVLQNAITAANQKIFDRSTQEPSLRGMGTTTTAALFKGDQLVIGHVGDSRIYFLNVDHSEEIPQLWQLTRDHSLIQEKLRARIITRAEAEMDPMKNIITRSVGFESQMNVEIYEKKVAPGEIFLMCSDGLSGMIAHLSLVEILQKHLIEEKNSKNTVLKLIEKANAQGGDDNITVILIECLFG